VIGRLLIVGTGLMGGSVAAAARSRGQAQEIWGVDPAHAQEAQDLGLLNRGFSSLTAALAACQAAPLQESSGTAVVLAAPVSLLAAMLPPLAEHHRQHPWAWVTEIGSTKRAVIEAMQPGAMSPQVSPQVPSGSFTIDPTSRFSEVFVPSHPMAGAERHGPEAATADLFVQARVLISPFESSAPAAIAQLESFWMALGGLPSRLPLKDHDALLADISHFPHLVAYGLAALLASGPSAHAAQTLYGGGLRDTTRIAASSPDLWADILLQNRQAVLGLMPQWNAVMQQLSQALADGDRAALSQMLEQAAQWRRGFR
jgi:prephenate dehydrogenase